LTCDDLKFKEIVLSIFRDYERIFTFRKLSKDVCKKLDTLNLFEKEKNTEYEGGIKLGIADSDKLQSIVWNQIWEHHLVIDLLNDPYDYTQDQESIRLIKTPVRE
jgi:hypothetical protein